MTGGLWNRKMTVVRKGQFEDISHHACSFLPFCRFKVSRCTLRSLACKRLPWTFSCKWFIYYLLFLESIRSNS